MLVAAVLLSSSLGVSYAKTDEICQQAETESEKQTESQKETESEKQSESQKETESEKQSESQKETESEKQSESQKESESEKETETNPGGENLPAERSMVLSSVRNYLLTKDANPDFSSIWNVIGLQRSGLYVPWSYTATFYQNVYAYCEQKNWKLTRTKYSDYSKLIMALTSIGIDAQNVGGHNLFDYLSDYENVRMQGINGPIWALIALDSGDYEVPEDAYQSREEILAELLKAQESDGGFSLSAGSGQMDVDITAMALTALAPYYEENSEAKVAADLALSWISEHQESDGGFCSSMDTGTESSESCAQVLTALCSLGIDPQSDSRFIKNGNTVLDNLMSFRQEDGGFVHAYVYDASNPASIPDESDFLAGGQAAYALTAFCRYKNNMKNLFNLRPEKASLLSKNGSAMPVMVIAVVIAVIAAAVVLMLKRRNKKE